MLTDCKTGSGVHGHSPCDQGQTTIDWGWCTGAAIDRIGLGSIQLEPELIVSTKVFCTVFPNVLPLGHLLIFEHQTTPY